MLKPSAIFFDRSTFAKRTFNRIWGCTAGTSTRRQIDHLAERRRDRHNPLRRGHILHRATHEGSFVFERQADVVARKIARQSAPAWPRACCHSSGSSGHTPGDCHPAATQSAKSRRGRSVDQNFLGVDRHGFRQRSVRHVHAPDVQRAIDDQRFSHRHHELARSARGIGACGSAAGAAVPALVPLASSTAEPALVPRPVAPGACAGTASCCAGVCETGTCWTGSCC